MSKVDRMLADMLSHLREEPNTQMSIATTRRWMYKHGDELLDALYEEAVPIIRNEVAPGNLSVGDYVFASRWSDCDPGDHWFVGHVCELTVEGVKLAESPNRVWRRAMKITPEQGHRIIDQYNTFDLSKRLTYYEELAEIFNG